MTPVCHFFQDIVQNLVHTRLLQFFPPKSFRINLKLFRPYEEEVPNRGFNFDDYRGTPGLEDISKCGSQGVNHEPSAERVALGSLYSRFESTGPDGQRAVAWEWMDLEQRAPFASFIMSFSFIKQLPGYDLVQWKQGKNTKLAREWLEQYSYYKDIVTGEWQRGGRKIEQGSINDDSDEAQNTIWMDESRNIGLRAKVIDKRARGRRGQMLSRASVHDVFSLDVEGTYTCPRSWKHSRIQPWLPPTVKLLTNQN